jgi:hypothetical protein
MTPADVLTFTGVALGLLAIAVMAAAVFKMNWHRGGGHD